MSTASIEEEEESIKLDYDSMKFLLSQRVLMRKIKRNWKRNHKGEHYPRSIRKHEKHLESYELAVYGGFDMYEEADRLKMRESMLGLLEHMNQICLQCGCYVTEV